MIAIANSAHRDDDILWDIADEHLRESEFLLTTRERLLDAPHYDLDELATGPDQRLLAHLDGLVLAGPRVAERLLLAKLGDDPTAEDLEQVCAATLALLLEPDRQLCQRALAVLDKEGMPEQRCGVVRALQLVRHAWLDAWLIQTLDTAPPAGIAARFEALADPTIVPDAWLRAGLASSDLALARAAARLARRSHDRDTLAALAPLAHADDPELRRITLESALCQHVPGAWESALYWARCPDESTVRRAAMVWLALLGDAGVRTELVAQVDDPTRRAHAVWALGFSGSPAGVDRCVELLADDQLGRLAGEVVVAVAGLPTDDQQFWRAEPEDDPESDPDQDLPELEADLAADLLPPPDDGLPLPNPESIAVWWHAHRDEFDFERRYLGGHLLRGDVLTRALRHTPMRRRHALALELALRTSGALVLDTRAFANVQLADLARLPAIATLDFQHGLPR